MNKTNNSKKLILITSLIIFILGLILFILGFIVNWIFGLFAIPFYVIGLCLVYLPFYKKVLKESGNDFLKQIKDEMKNAESQQEKLVCPNCNTENASESKFCKECGNPLSKICPYCDVKIDNDSKFCNHCGKEV
ncbi:MAG: zinc ribbon domain-containing protein [Clostridia bacterium]|nr:zinc ribbon domain-containing protein [Clostridia bacterium]